MNQLQKSLADFLSVYPKQKSNLSKSELIKEAVLNKEAFITKTGNLATWTHPDSTGRSPEDTVTVKRPSATDCIDWTSKNNIAISEETFDMIFEDAMGFLKQKDKLYIQDKAIGADHRFALPLKIITDRALGGVFSENMFREIPTKIQESCFFNKTFTLITLPFDKLSPERYQNRLRKLPSGQTSSMVIAMDLDRKIAIIIGSSYLGTMKKTIFTVMNYYLPLEGVLPLHCSANEGKSGDTAIMLGLSGTGKTTLSADPKRKLLGDDEHGWCEHGVFNFENGCYAKMLDMTKEAEPEIWEAIMHEDEYQNHGAIIENAFMYPNGEFDFSDSRLTQNSRASYPLTYLKNIKTSSVGGPPKTIIFLTADAYGVIPPISKLNHDQAMLWFLMGYTSKLAGTERGVKEPQATFSRFFGAPFMPSNPAIYAKMLGDKIDKYKTNVFLINTGWVGGKYGVGKRIKLSYTRSMLEAAICGNLDQVEYSFDEIFQVNIPKTCPEVPEEILSPKNMWGNETLFLTTAHELAKQFQIHFDKSFSNNQISDQVAQCCPGKNFTKPLTSIASQLKPDYTLTD
ncbi:MAG: phosphoenolpyruvate carboxykinase (ATP) [Bdellovibrionales bacterium RIFOXYA1_FULL_36_14]|nr:MAG: phosphoenolpyruvate carboxykinase (ATP) [Bdellovibrionales bacterium RIFOXYA1_FULL_36_14]